MGKYYVQSHLYKMVLTAESPIDAARRSLNFWLLRDKTRFNAGPITNVSELGFDDPEAEYDNRHASDHMFDTEAITGKKARTKKRKS